jgi:hypothetical protein
MRIPMPVPVHDERADQYGGDNCEYGQDDPVTNRRAVLIVLPIDRREWQREQENHHNKHERHDEQGLRASRPCALRVARRSGRVDPT